MVNINLYILLSGEWVSILLFGVQISKSAYEVILPSLIFIL